MPGARPAQRAALIDSSRRDASRHVSRRSRLHDARRTCATLLVDLDVHPRIVMEILRHAQIEVTMEIRPRPRRL